MLAIKIHNALQSIAENTFDKKQLDSFWVDIIAAELKTKHADYIPKERLIKIYNLSRPTVNILTAAIHQLAHHCEYCLNKNKRHNESFYKTFHSLLSTAVIQGIINKSELQKINDSSTLRMVRKNVGEITADYNQRMHYKNGQVHIKIDNAYAIKSKLKYRGYKYDGFEQLWVKTMPETKLAAEERFLHKATDKDNIIINPANRIDINAIYYLLVEEAYEYKKELEDKGYSFKGYNFKGNVWVKKITARDFYHEKWLLKPFQGIRLTIKGAL